MPEYSYSGIVIDRRLMVIPYGGPIDVFLVEARVRELQRQSEHQRLVSLAAKPARVRVRGHSHPVAGITSFVSGIGAALARCHTASHGWHLSIGRNRHVT